MRSLWGAVLTATVVGALPMPAFATAHDCDRRNRDHCSEASGDGVTTGTGTDQASPRPVSDGDGSGPSAPKSPFRVETKWVPTCEGSDGVQDIGLCTAALTSCPTPGDVRFWVYRRTIDTRIPGDNPPFMLVETPPYICRSLDEVPALDPLLAIPALVEEEFARAVILKGVPEVSPAPDTLVRIPTIFTSSSPASYDIPLTLLGRSVVITATAATYTWHFGDGTSASTSTLGTQGRVEHVYTASAPRNAYVVIEWTGTFTVDGGPVQQVNGTATTTGDPVAIEVKQARTELVDAPS